MGLPPSFLKRGGLMALSEVYTTDCKWLGFSGNALAIVGSKTFNELFPADSTDFDESVLLCCGSTSQYLNYGAYGSDGYLKKNSGTPSIVDGSAGRTIAYLGACLIYNTSSSYEYINISKRKVNTYSGSYTGSWDNVKNARFIIDCCNAGLYGGAPYSWDDFDYPARKNSCYHFNGVYTKLQYQYSTNSGATSSTSSQSAASITGDNRKRILKGALNTYVTNYQSTMADNTSLASVEVTLMFAFNINDEIILVRNPDNVPLPLATGSKQYITIDGVNQYLTIGDSCNASNTNVLPDSDEKWSLWAFGNWDGGYWSNLWSAYYKTVNAVFYIYNSTGIRWLDYADAPANAGQFRSNVNLGVMNDAGIINHTQWLHGEENIQNSDNPNKSGNYDNIPDRPGPTPPGPGPYDDDPWHGATFSGVGVGGIGAFARCYYMTSTELANLRSWMGSINVPEGFNPMAQIIGLSQLPVALSGDDSTTIQFVNSSAVYDPGVTTRVVDSGVTTQYAMGLPIKYSLGSVDITRRMQERGEPYLDYSCQIELYLPLVGVFSLDTQAVMGKTIEAEAVLDPISGTLAAYAYVTRDGEKLPIAYGSTTIAVDLPITAQQYSMSKAALKQANAQLYSSLLSGALTTLAAASAAGKASASGAGRSATASSGLTPQNSFTQSASIAGSHAMVSQTGNVFGSFMEWGRTIRQLSYGNNTAIAGSFGGSVAQWSYPFTAYVKIIRPRFEKPANYAHSQGVPCIQTKRIGDCTGFMQCVGVDVINIDRATDLEKQAIAAALANGVYAGGGGE